jgi:hypothetical protein
MRWGKRLRIVKVLFAGVFARFLENSARAPFSILVNPAKKSIPLGEASFRVNFSGQTVMMVFYSELR